MSEQTFGGPGSMTQSAGPTSAPSGGTASPSGTASQDGPTTQIGPTLGSLVLLVLALAFVLPAISPAGFPLAFRLLAGIAILFGFGTICGWLLLPSARGSAENLLLSLPLGIIIFSGAAQIGFNCGAVWFSYFLLPFATLLAVPGCLAAFFALRLQWGRRVRYGWATAAAIAAAMVLYYVPQSQLDALPTADGGFKWWYADSFFHEAMTVELQRSLALGELPPTTPGFYRQKICYQYGRHAMAAHLAYWLGATPIDMTARGLTLLGLLAIAAATVFAARRLTADARLLDLTSLAALVLVFLVLGADVTLSNVNDTSYRKTFQLIPAHWSIFPIGVWDCTGDFAHGGSSMWACLVAFTLVGILLRAQSHSFSDRFPWQAVVLAALGIGLNSIAAIAVFAVAVMLALLRGWRSWQTYLFAGLAAALVYLCFSASGFQTDSHRQMTMKIAESKGTLVETGQQWMRNPLDARARRELLSSLYEAAYAVVRNLATLALAGIMLLFGLRSLALLNFAWGQPRVRELLAVLAVVYMGVFLAVTLLGYPVPYFGTLLSLFAAAPAAAILSATKIDAMRLWADAAAVYRRYAVGVFTLCLFAAIPTLFVILHRRSLHGLPNPSKGILIAVIVSCLLFLLLRGVTRLSWPAPRTFCRAAVATILIMSTLGLARNCATNIFDPFEGTITLDAGRTASLRFIHDKLPPQAVLATTQHYVPTRDIRERSLMYSALTGRRILLEGWRYMTAQGSPEFEAILRDNATLFKTSDAAECLGIAERYAITYLLVEPNTGLGFDPDRVAWLRRVPNPGSIAIWEVVPASR